MLHACLNELGFKCRQIICTFRWDEQKIKYPQRLESILKEGSWLHGHTYLQIEVDDRWVDTDVTWNPKLKPYGFKTFPEKWNGETPFIGIDNIKRRWVGLKGKEIRTNLIESLTVETRDRRERFLKEFFKWIDSLNKT